MKNIFKNFTTGKLKIFSAACSALMLLQTACVPTYAIYNELMSKIERTRYVTVKDIIKIVEDDPDCVREICGNDNIMDYVLYEGVNTLKNRAAIAKYLIEHYDDTPVTCDNPRHLDPYKWGCANEQFGFSSWLLKESGYNLESLTAGSETVAHIAAYYGRIEDLKYIKQKDRLLLADDDGGGITPLRDAALSGEYSTAEWLLNNATYSLSDLQNAFDTANEKRHCKIAELIKKPLEAKRKTKEEYNERVRKTLFNAIKKGDTDAVRQWLKNNRDMLKDMKDEDRNGPIHIAMYHDRNEIAALLLDASEHLPGRRYDYGECKYIAYENGRNGNTPLHIAVARDNVEGVKLLLRYCPSRYLNDVNNGGFTPLDVCIDPETKPNPEIKELLKKAGAKHNKGLLFRGVAKILQHI